MTDSPTKTVEQIAADAMNELWGGETVDGSKWSADSHEAATIATAFRDAGLLVSGERERLALMRVWRAIGNAGNPDDFKTSVRDTMWDQLVELLEQYATQGTRLHRENEQLRAELAGVESRASGAPSEEQIEQAARAMHETKNPWVDAYGDWGAAGFEIKEAFRESARAALTNAGVGSPVPVQVDETLKDRVEDTLAYYQCRETNPKADHPRMGYHAFSEEQRAFLKSQKAEAAAEILRMIRSEQSKAWVRGVNDAVKAVSESHGTLTYVAPHDPFRLRGGAQ